MAPNPYTAPAIPAAKAVGSRGPRWFSLAGVAVGLSLLSVGFVAGVLYEQRAAFADREEMQKMHTQQVSELLHQMQAMRK